MNTLPESVTELEVAPTSWRGAPTTILPLPTATEDPK